MLAGRARSLDLGKVTALSTADAVEAAVKAPVAKQKALIAEVEGLQAGYAARLKVLRDAEIAATRVRPTAPYPHKI